MNRWFARGITAALIALFTLSAMAQDKLELPLMKTRPEKFQRVEPVRDQIIRAHSPWRSRSIGVDNPESFKLQQDFEGATYPPTGWTLVYSGTQYWTRAGVSGYQIGTGSSKFDFWTASSAITQSLVSPTFVSPSVAGDSLKFDYAHAYYDASSIDSLIIETSTNGGSTWTSLDRLYSSPTPFLSLSTVSSTSLFTPASASDWGTKRYPLPTGTNMVRFTAISGFGNNLYIDNILVGAPDPNDIAATAFVSPTSGGAVTPNTTFTPSSSFTNVGTATQTNVNVKYEIRNSVPTVVYTSTKSIASIAPGVTTTVTFDPVSGGLPAGVYTIRSVVTTPDANAANDTLNGTLRSLGPLTGTKTIGGTTPDYPNFTSAIGDLLAGGVGAGGVTFNVRPGVYGTDAGTEADTVLTFVSAIAGASASNPIIFQKQSGTVTIERSGTGSASDYIVLLNGTDYVTFDGIDLRQRAGSNAVEFGYVLQAASGTDGAQNNTLKNFSVTLNALTNPNVSIAVFMTLGTASNQAGTNSNNKFYNFNLSGGTWGFQIFGTLGLPDMNTEIGTLPGGTSTISYGHRTQFNGAVGFGNQDNIRVFNVEVLSGFQAGAVSLYGIAAPFAGSAIGTAYIYNNKVHGMIDSSTTTGNNRAIAAVNLGTFHIYNNRVYDMYHATTSSAFVAGISIENATLANVYNNFVSDVRAPAGTGTTVPTVRGISVTAGINVNIYNNTVYLNAPNTSVSRSSAALYATTTPTVLDIRNNILINNSAAGSGTTGRQSAFAFSSTVLTNIASTTNNNLLYAGPVAGSTNLRALFYPASGTGDTTLAQYITRMAPREAAAVTENTTFRNTTTTPYDLHVDSTVATRAESGGNNAPGVTTDIDGQPRVIATAPNVAPDIGADEFGGIPVDNVGPVITHTQLSSTNLTTDRSLSATIKDLVSGVDRRPGLKPRVYYKKNGGSNWTTFSVDSAGVPGANNLWTFTIASAAMGGLATGDTVYYYIAAADSAGNVSTSPAGGSGLTPPGNVVPPTTYGYRISSALAGTFTIGASGATWTTVKAAFDSINASTVTGAITLLINADYAGDAVFPITLNAVNYGTGGPYRITLKPASGATPSISGVSTTSIIKLNGADYVTIDGSNSGGTSRDLTIANTSTATSTAAIWLSSLGAGAGCTNDTLRNLTIRTGPRADSTNLITWGIFSGGTALSTVGDGQDNDNNVFINNAITRASYGIQLRGATVNTNDNNVISGNIVGPTVFGSEEIGRVGILVQHQNNCTITLNEVRFVGGTVATSLSGRDRIGIGLGSEFWTTSNTLVTNSTVTRNLIHDIVEERTFSAVGIVLGSSASPSSNTVANNMIYNVRADGTAGDQGVGIGIGAGNGDRVVYNSVAMRDSLDPGTAATASVSAVGIRIGNLNPTVANLTLRNNAISVDVASKTGTLRHFAIVAPSATFQFGSGVLDNNVYHINTANAQMALGGIGTAVPYTVQQDLAAWRTQFGGVQDANSSAGDPGYIDPRANVHVNPLGPSSTNNAGAPIAGITIDYDGQTRSTTTPDIGADEYTAIAPVITGVARSTRVPFQGDSLVVTCTITDSLGVSTANLLYMSDGVAQTPVVMTRTSGTPTNGTYRGVIPGSANQNGKRIEYQIQANSTGGNSTTTAVVAANSYFAGYTNMSLTGFRAMAANRSLLYTNYYVRTTGTVNSPNFTALSGRISYMFQDAVGGTNVNRAATTLTLNIGDSITVLGLIGQFRGTTQLTPDSLSDITVVATGRTVPVTEVTVNAFNANPEQYESRLIRMTSLNRIRSTPAWGNNAAIPVYQGTLADSTLLFLDADTPVPSCTEPTYPVTVVGVAGQFSSSTSVFDNGYEIIPRACTDFSSGLPGLVGSYTVGTGGNFPTLSRAIFVLDSAGVAGPVTFSLISTSYTDTALIILPYPGQSATNLVTFKPASGVTARVLISGGSTTNAGFGIRMDSVAGVVWDGSNSGGTDRSLTIETDTNTTTARTPFYIRKGSRNVTLKNMIIKGNRHSAGSIPSVVVIDNTGFASSGGQHNITITNCQLMRGNNGIFQSAASGAVRDSNHTFTNNLIGGGSSVSVLDHLAAQGITMTGNHNVLIDNNDINGIKVAGTPIGIAVRGANTAVTVTRNKVHNLVTTSGAFRPLCFLVGNIIATGPGVMTQAVIANNMAYDIHNFGTGAAGRAVDGLIYNPTGGTNSPNGVGSTIDWFYNSWNIDMAAGEGAGNTAFWGDMNFAFSNPNPAHYDSIRIYNNVASIKRAGADSLNARMWLIFGEGVAGNNRMRSNNNVFYTNYPAQFAQIPSPWPGGTTAAFVPTLASFRDSTRLDSSSVFGNPQFVSSTDAHIRTNIATPVESRGRAFAGFTTDIDGDLRDATTPDAGADEGVFVPFTLGHVTASLDTVNGKVALAWAPTSRPEGKRNDANDAIVIPNEMTAYADVQASDGAAKMEAQTSPTVNVKQYASRGTRASAVARPRFATEPAAGKAANALTDRGTVNEVNLAHVPAIVAQTNDAAVGTVGELQNDGFAQGIIPDLMTGDAATANVVSPLMATLQFNTRSTEREEGDNPLSITRYLIYRSLSGGAFSLYDSVAAGASSYTDSLLQARPTRYYVAARFTNGTSAPSETVSVNVPYVVREAEPNNSVATATWATLGRSLSASLTSGDVDWYRFSATAGHLIVDGTNTGNTTDVIIGLFDSTGTRELYEIDRNINDRLEYNLPVAGTYYVRITPYSTSTGPYTLFARIGTGTDPYEPDDGPLMNFPLVARSITPVGYRDTVSTIDPGVGYPGFDLDYRYFPLTVNQQIRVVLRTRLTFPNSTMKGGYVGIGRKGLPASWIPALFGGTPLAAKSDSLGTVADTLIYTATVADTYYVYTCVHLMGASPFGMNQAGPNARYDLQIDRTVGVDEVSELPTVFALNQNYPNPFNPSTQIKYALPKESAVTLRIYNVLGQEVVTLVDNVPKSAGYYTVLWNGRNRSGSQVASGIYFYRIEAKPTNGEATFTDLKKMVLLK